MPVPTEPSDWLLYLGKRHDAEIPELEAYDRWYEGTQPVAYMHPEIWREVSDRIKPVILAWPQLVVDTVEERLDVEGFRVPVTGRDRRNAEPNADHDEDTPEGAADQDLWRVWQANDLDEQSQMAHTDALVMRRSYVCVGSNEDDRDTPLVTVESPMEVFADIDPRTRQVRAALRRILEEDSYARVNERYATLYLPNSTIWYRWDGGWLQEDRDDHNLGVVPVQPLTNRPRLRRGVRLQTGEVAIRFGRSELHSVLPLANSANKIATDMMLASEFVALPLRGFWGIGPDDLVDQHGNKLTALQAIMGRLLLLKDADGKQFEFPGANLSGFHTTLAELARMVASLAGLPPHYFGLNTDNPASADAIRSAESRLVKRAERKQRLFGGPWERVMRLVRRFQDGDWDPRLRQLETIWRDPSTPTVAQAADAAVKLYTTQPRPIVPLHMTREKLGFTATEITRMEAEDAKAAAQDPVAAIARGLADPTGADPAATAPAGGDTAEDPVEAADPGPVARRPPDG